MVHYLFCVPLFVRSLSVILILDLSKPNALWGTMEKLLQSAHAQLDKVSSQAQQAEKSRHRSKHQTPVHSAARVLPKDYPVWPFTFTNLLAYLKLFILYFKVHELLFSQVSRHYCFTKRDVKSPTRINNKV